MKKTTFIFLLLTVLSVNLIFAQNIKDYKTGKTLFNFSNDGVNLQDYQAGKTLLYSEDKNIKDYKLGKTLFNLDSSLTYLYIYSTGKVFLKIDGEYIRDQSNGKILWVLTEKKHLKDFASGSTLYESTEPLNTIKICMVLYALKFIDNEGIKKKN